VAIHKTRFGQIDGLHFGIKFEQRNGDRARQVSFEPFRPASNINQLHRWTPLQCLADIRTLPHSYAGKVEAFRLPPGFVCEHVPDHKPKTNPGQSNMGFLNVGNCFPNQHDPLARSNQKRSPTRELASETNLYRSPHMKRGKSLCGPCVQDEGALRLFLNRLCPREKPKCQ